MRKKRTRKNPLVTGIHIGTLVADKIKELNLSNAEVGQLLGRTENTIKTFLKTPSLQSYILWEFSIALGYNFFHHLSEQLIAKEGEKNISSTLTDKTIDAPLQQEIQRLTKERDYLKKMMINLRDKK